MTRRGKLQLDFVSSDDGRHRSIDCPHTEPVYGAFCDIYGPIHCRIRPPACIAAEQTAASVPSCEGAAWAVGDRVRARCDGDEGTIVGVGDNHVFIAWDSFKANGREPMRWGNCDNWSDITRIPADDHLDGGARALDASEALREARVQGMREGFAICDAALGSNHAALEAAIEAVRKGER